MEPNFVLQIAFQRIIPTLILQLFLFLIRHFLILDCRLINLSVDGKIVDTVFMDN